jgi:hypothetical protein
VLQHIANSRRECLKDFESVNYGLNATSNSRQTSCVAMLLLHLNSTCSNVVCAAPYRRHVAVQMQHTCEHPSKTTAEAQLNQTCGTITLKSPSWTQCQVDLHMPPPNKQHYYRSKQMQNRAPGFICYTANKHPMGADATRTLCGIVVLSGGHALLMPSAKLRHHMSCFNSIASPAL